jgi:hypothetical protein
VAFKLNLNHGGWLAPIRTRAYSSFFTSVVTRHVREMHEVIAAMQEICLDTQVLGPWIPSHTLEDASGKASFKKCAY